MLPSVASTEQGRMLDSLQEFPLSLGRQMLVSAESAVRRRCELGTDAGFACLYLSSAQKRLANKGK